MSFEKFSFVFESCFESVVMCDFEIRQVFCFASLIQVTKRLSTPKFLKDYSYVSTLLTSLFHHCIWWTILCEDVKGTGAGHRLDHERNSVKCLMAIFLRDYDHFI